MKTDNKEGSAVIPSDPREGGRLALSGWPLVTVAAVLVASVAINLMLWGGHSGPRQAPANQPLTFSANLVPGRDGPWGSIAYYPVVLSAPAEYIMQFDPATSGNSWYFDQMDEASLREFFSHIDISPEVRQRLLASAKPMEAPDMGMVIAPDWGLVRSLSPKARGEIYHHLALFEKNQDQANAFRFCGASPDDWFRGAGLSEETLELAKPLVYRNGNYMFLADFGHVFAAISDPDERNRLGKALARDATFMARVWVPQNADVEPLVRYWGRGGRENDVRPILESMAQREGGGGVNVALLLPPFARQRIFTYPPPSNDPLFSLRDCHWNALNFFNFEADDRLADRAQQSREIEENYRPIFANLELGDLVCFIANGQVIHTAVYIADDVLLTKNGSRSSEPSMLIRMSDMKDFYPQAEPLRIVYYRRKDL